MKKLIIFGIFLFFSVNLFSKPILKSSKSKTSVIAKNSFVRSYSSKLGNETAKTTIKQTKKLKSKISKGKKK